MCGFKISDTAIREERIKKRRSRAEPWDARADARGSNEGLTTSETEIKRSTSLQIKEIMYMKVTCISLSSYCLASQRALEM